MRRVIGFFVAAIMAMSVFSQSSAENVQKKAVVGYIKGDVKVTKKDENKSNPAKLGMTLSQGDKISTGADSRVELKFDDGTNFRIGDNSSVVLEELRQDNSTDKSTMKVIFGRAWLNIKKTIDGAPKDSKIVTPRVTAAVKGTTYRVDVDKEGETTVNVYDGTVAVNKDGTESSVTKLERVTSKDFLKAKFDENEDAKDEWVRWNKNRDKIRVMVAFTEKKNGQLSVIPLSEVIFAEELLKNYLYSVIDQATLNQIREDEKVKAALSDDKDGKKAAAAGLELGADIIITGQVDASAMDTGAAFGMFTGIADMAVRVIKCDTAEIVAAKNMQNRKPDLMQQGAFNNAIRVTSAKLVDALNDEIVKAWKKEAARGASLNVVLTGVTFESSEKVRQALSAIQGVKNVSQVSLVASRSLITLTFAGDSLSLAEKISQLSVSNLKTTVVGLSMNKLEVEVK